MVHTIWVRSRRMTRASGMNSRALWRNVRGIQTAPFSATPKAPRTMASAGEIAGIFQFVGVECGAGCGFGQIGGYASGFRVGPADNGGYALPDAA